MSRDMKKHVNKHKPAKKLADYGNTPVGIETPKEEKPRPAGLRQRILTASSVEEIQALLHEGAEYRQASDKTARRWLIAADKRRAFFKQVNLGKAYGAGKNFERVLTQQ